MTSVSADQIILTPTKPVGSGRPQQGSNSEPPHQESRALPTELPHPLPLFPCALAHSTTVNRRTYNLWYSTASTAPLFDLVAISSLTLTIFSSRSFRSVVRTWKEVSVDRRVAVFFRSYQRIFGQTFSQHHGWFSSK